MMPDLSGSYTVLAVDMPGHGATALSGARSLADYVGRLLAFVDALEGPVRLVGHSMGAMIALEAAVARPGKVCGVAALNAIYRRSPAAARAVRARADALGRAAPADPAATLARWFGTVPDAALRAAAAACGRWLTDADPAGYARAYTVFAESDGPQDADLVQLGVPALFMTGAQDPNSTPAMARAMAALAPQGKAQVLVGAAHMMPMTHPAKVCAALRKAFGSDETDPPPS
jgi:pimeloyl-ACP methyl ester carboxylesterase